MRSKYLKSKWTSVQKKYGWRHYEVRNFFKKQKKVELFSVCDNSVVFLVDMNEIENRKRWIPGWKEII